MDTTNIIKSTKKNIHIIRNQNVLIDTDLAKIYGVETKRLNEQVRRNIEKFPEDFMFQLTQEEFENLKSQNATSSWGGKRKLPYAFTEHGVLQAASVLNSGLANSVSIFVIRAFVEMRQIIASQQEIIAENKQLVLSDKTTELKINKFFQDIKPKLLGAINNVLDTVVDTTKGTTLKEEAQDILRQSIQHLKERLKKTGLENEEIVARITKILAEAEKERATARKVNAETEQIEFLTTVRKLRLVLEAQKVLMGAEPHEIYQIDNFISILKELNN